MNSFDDGAHGGDFQLADVTSLFAAEPDLEPGPSSSGRQRCIAEAVEADVLPRLLAVAGLAEPEKHAVGDPVELEVFCDLLLADGLTDSFNFIETSIRRGRSLEKIYLNQIVPAARRFGFMWEQDVIGFSEVTLGLARLQQIQRRLSPSFVNSSPEPRVAVNRPKALFTTTPGDTHALGILLVADFFARAGFATSVEVNPTTADLARRVVGEGIGLLGISAGASRFVADLTDTITTLRAAAGGRPLTVLAGGFAFMVEDPPTAEMIGADHVVCDPQKAIDLVESELN